MKQLDDARTLEWNVAGLKNKELYIESRFFW